MSLLSDGGVSIDVPSGWEGEIDGGGVVAQAGDGVTRSTLAHVATFPLPSERGTFGSGATELMNTDDILIVLFEYGSDSADTPLFAAQGVPRRLDPEDFDREALQRIIIGQSGAQRFFTEAGRAFCLYVVLGSHIDRSELVPRVNAVLATIEIS